MNMLTSNRMECSRTGHPSRKIQAMPQARESKLRFFTQSHFMLSRKGNSSILFQSRACNGRLEPASVEFRRNTSSRKRDGLGFL